MYGGCDVGKVGEVIVAMYGRHRCRLEIFEYTRIRNYRRL